MKSIRRYIEKIIEKFLFLCSLVSGLLVIFIVFFLFKEGIGLFNKPIVDENYVLVVNPQNTINSLTSKQIDLIFNQDITNWNKIGGSNDTIILFTINDISNFFTEEDLGSDFENLPQAIDELITKSNNIIAFIPKSNISQDFKGKIIEIQKISILGFLSGKDWYPTTEPAPQFGVLPLILGTLMVSIVAILISLPIGLITAVYMAEVASVRFRNFLKPVIELLAGIPSVVYGFFGLVIVVPLIQQTFGLAVGETALTGSIILAIMALPTIITISEDALRTTPKALKEASLALGANTLQTLLRVTIPYAKSGVTAAAILGIGRAVGETMAVLMVTGNASVIPTSVLQPVRTIPATIAAELGEAPFGGVHFKALFTLGIILFLFTMTFNFVVDMVKNRQKRIK